MTMEMILSNLEKLNKMNEDIYANYSKIQAIYKQLRKKERKEERERKFNLLKALFNNIDDFQINNIITSTTSIHELFTIHKLNTNLEYLIVSLPKTGTSTIIHYLIEYKNINTRSYHSIIEFIYIDKRFVNYTIKEVIEYISYKTSYKKLYIIFSYREPQSRCISRYLWEGNINNVLANIKIVDKTIYNLINYHANNDYNILTNMLDDFDINLDNYTYDHKKGYSLIPYNNKITFVFTILSDINLFLRNFLELYIEADTFNKNFENNSKITFNTAVKNELYVFEKKLVKFYNLS